MWWRVLRHQCCIAAICKCQKRERAIQRALFPAVWAQKYMCSFPSILMVTLCSVSTSLSPCPSREGGQMCMNSPWSSDCSSCYSSPSQTLVLTQDQARWERLPSVKFLSLSKLERMTKHGMTLWVLESKQSEVGVCVGWPGWGLSLYR